MFVPSFGLRQTQTNMAQNLTRQAAALFPPDERERLQLLMRWAAAIGWVLKSHLRANHDLKGELQVCAGGRLDVHM